MTDMRSNCRNCGEALYGKYCTHCGQEEGRGDLSFGEVVGELVEELISWDSRFWRTLIPLVFRPGFLTAEFLAGRRARYVPPFRLYLIISFVLFLVVSVLARDSLHVMADGEISSSRGGVHVLLPGDSPGTGAAPGSTPAAQVDGDRIADAGVSIGLSDENSAQWLKNLDRRLEVNAEKLKGDPDAFLERLIEYLPQMMFLLLPIFALFLRFCYLFSPFHYLQHLVFSLHFHSFVYLLYLLGQLGDFWLQANPLGKIFPLVVLLYLPLAMMRTYGSGMTGALGKASFIVVADAVLLLMAFAGVSLLTLALM